MKMYEGRRTVRGCVVTVDGKSLPPRNDVRNHSPTGFEWGYGGSGPAQLALAILCDHFGDSEKAREYYQGFKFMVIAKIRVGRWRLTTLDVDQAVNSLELGREMWRITERRVEA